ncbi:ras-GEF domain-containing family member 1A isoform X3 [Heterocephalus glaber]|uniref:Ras-GEF domain-containing family member 1A isoform X3 n=1 Tax=Heterocephalus glaber TaxID=10181 RepID=A0AAX6SEI4_HETGA|nr:ras-GEF domain-containing family member 1A isoform X3 [Heterocephalus glaber]
MPQTSVVFSGILGPGGSGQVQPGMGERGSGAGDLIFQDGRLVSGSLEALMEHLVPTVDYYPDATPPLTSPALAMRAMPPAGWAFSATRSPHSSAGLHPAGLWVVLGHKRTFIFTFLLTSRVFMPPHDLLARVGQICLEQRQQLEPGPEKAKLKSFSAKIVQLLKEWTEAFPYDFQDEKALGELKAIAYRVTQCDEENGTVKKAITQMIQSLLLSLAARSQLQELREKLRPPAVDKGPVLKAKPPAAQKDILGVCCDPLVLAQQLTHIELERVSSIHPEDLMQIISHTDSLDNHRPGPSEPVTCLTLQCRGDVAKTYSLEAYDSWFNCLSMLVATEVCRVVKKKHRTRMLEFFIDVAPGMNLSPVARLKKTWSKVKTAKFDVLEHHMDPSSNFCNYRTALQGATQRSQTANSSREKIVIPVFNLFVKDIYFLHKIHTNHLPNGHINFKKFWEISRQIHEFMTWTQVECPFEKDKKIQSYLLTAPIYSEEALFIASFESEGPENHMEKDSWKALRTTLLHRA